MRVIHHLSSARVTTLATLLLCLALSACGGGGDADAVADNPQIPPVTQPVTPPVTTPTTPPTASEQDLAGFTAAWMSYQMLASVNMLQMAAGGTGSCGLGGTVAYDAVAGVSTLEQCHTRAFPYQVYSGRNSISQLVSNTDRSQVSAAIRSPSVRVVSADTGALEYTITDGEITGDVVSSESGDRFSFTATGLRIRAGQASDYTISNAGSTSTTVVFRNGQPERTSNNISSCSPKPGGLLRRGASVPTSTVTPALCSMPAVATRFAKSCIPTTSASGGTLSTMGKISATYLRIESGR